MDLGIDPFVTGIVGRAEGEVDLVAVAAVPVAEHVFRQRWTGPRLDGAGEADGAVVGVGGAGQCRQQDKDSAEGRVGTPLGRAG